MWTKENRGRYDRSRLRYPSDLTDEEWALVESLIAPAKRGGNKRTVKVREVVIDLAWTRDRFKDRPDEFFIKPTAIAEEIWHVAHQDRSAWSFNVELRPFGQSW